MRNPILAVHNKLVRDIVDNRKVAKLEIAAQVNYEPIEEVHSDLMTSNGLQGHQRSSLGFHGAEEIENAYRSCLGKVKFVHCEIPCCLNSEY